MPETSSPSKTLILLFDGTLDRYDTAISNIARLTSFLEKNDPSKQLVYYQAGIGTRIGPAYLGRAIQYLDDLWDSAFATSLDNHVMLGYRFLQTNWKEGDRICLFGFSRGAYTARALNGMLSHVGLLPPGMTEEVRFAYSIYRHQKQSAQYKHDFSRNVMVEFIGVFDTVSAVGTMLPKTLPFPGNNHMVKTFRHAMSLDEHRAAFQPKPWVRSVPGDELSIRREKGVQRIGVVRSFFGAVGDSAKRTLSTPEMGPAIVVPPWKGTDCKEVYFAGCHSDVGGGSVPNGTKYSLENISLRWMIKEILEAQPGIIFRDDPRLVDLGIILNPKAGREIKVSTGTSQRATSPASNVGADLEPPEHDDLPSPYLPVDARPQDVSSPSVDKLKNPAWWLLEILPFVAGYQDSDDVWHNHLRFNLFRGRKIQPAPAPTNPNSKENDDPRGANVSSAPALFHVSVKARMEAPEAKQRSAGSLWVKKKPYGPRAKMMQGEPKFVR